MLILAERAVALPVAQMDARSQLCAFALPGHTRTRTMYGTWDNVMYRFLRPASNRRASTGEQCKTVKRPHGRLCDLRIDQSAASHRPSTDLEVYWTQSKSASNPVDLGSTLGGHSMVISGQLWTSPDAMQRYHRPVALWSTCWANCSTHAITLPVHSS